MRSQRTGRRRREKSARLPEISVQSWPSLLRAQERFVVVLESDTGRARDHASLRCQCGGSPAIGKGYTRHAGGSGEPFILMGDRAQESDRSRTASHRPRRAAERCRRSDSADDRLLLVSRPHHSRPTVTHAAHSHQFCIGLMPILERGLPREHAVSRVAHCFAELARTAPSQILIATFTSSVPLAR